MYETGGGGPLPKNGEEWHNIREGKLKVLQQYSQDFNDLIKVRYRKGKFSSLVFSFGQTIFRMQFLHHGNKVRHTRNPPPLSLSRALWALATFSVS
jgi:hypothetical protein